MKLKLTAGFLVLTIFLLMSQTVLAADSRRFSAEISAEMELLAGVLSHTTWMNQAGPQGKGNEYFRSLKEFFAPYQKHEAVTIAQELTTMGFSFDAPIGFICHLGPLPQLDLEHEYSPYIIGRARDRDRLERFRVALRDLAEESNFLEFFGSWQPSFQAWIDAASMDGDMVVTWLENFFGRESEAFHLILAPAMFPGGGYGATVTTAEGENISFQVIRERGSSDSMPVFPEGRDLEYLSLHEWGHSFVNPAIDAHSSTVSQLNKFFTPVARAMKSQAYGNVHVFMNEQVLRAVTTIAAYELYGEEAYAHYLANETRRSFYLTEDIVSILRHYQENRDVYPSFDLFVPEMLARIAELKVKPFLWIWTSLYGPGLALGISIGLLIAGVKRVLRRRKTDAKI